MTREAIPYPKVKLLTPCGDVEIMVIEREKIWLRSSSIFIDEVEHYIGILFTRKKNGSYHIKKGAKGITAERTFAYSMGERASLRTSNVKEKLEAIMVPLVNQWAASNPEIIERGEWAEVNNKIRFREEFLQELAKQVLSEREIIKRRQQLIQENIDEIKQLCKRGNETAILSPEVLQALIDS